MPYNTKRGTLLGDLEGSWVHAVAWLHYSPLQLKASVQQLAMLTPESHCAMLTPIMSQKSNVPTFPLLVFPKMNLFTKKAHGT